MLYKSSFVVIFLIRKEGVLAQFDKYKIDDDYLTSNSKEFICFSLGLSGSESLSSISLAHLWDFLFKFF